jgi:hypothetical protein
MALQHQNQESTRQRINEYLRGKTIGHAAAETLEGDIQAFVRELEQAEQELKTANNRVGRLRWELAKFREKAQS